MKARIKKERNLVTNALTCIQFHPCTIKYYIPNIGIWDPNSAVARLKGSSLSFFIPICTQVSEPNKAKHTTDRSHSRRAHDERTCILSETGGPDREPNILKKIRKNAPHRVVFTSR